MTVQSYGLKASLANVLIKERILTLEESISVTDGESDVFLLNNSPSSISFMDSDSTFLLNYAIKMNEKTGGALNVALYPVIREWGFTKGNYKIPSSERLNELLKATDLSSVKITPLSSGKSQVRMKSGMMVDFGSIGKGYACDVACDIYRRNGVKCALLDFGGNIFALGTKPDGTAWNVGIRNPWGGEPVLGVKASDSAVVTSGGYERFFIGEDGKKYSHIFDPATGCPVENNIESVSIIAKNALYADSLSTSLFVMGVEKAADFWKENKDFEFIIILKDDGLVYSSGLEEKLSFYHEFKSVSKVL